MSDAQDWSEKAVVDARPPSKRTLWWVLGCAGGLVLGVLALGIVATIVVPQMLGGPVHKARVEMARAQIAELEVMLESERVRLGAYPRSLEELAAPGSKFAGRVLPVDPWGHSYVYVAPTVEGAKPTVVSYGADGKPGGEGRAADVSSR